MIAAITITGLHLLGVLALFVGLLVWEHLWRKRIDRIRMERRVHVNLLRQTGGPR